MVSMRSLLLATAVVVAVAVLANCVIRVASDKKKQARRQRSATRLPTKVPAASPTVAPAPWAIATRAPSDIESRIHTYLKTSIYQPFIDATSSDVYVISAAENRDVYSVLVSTGDALDHFGVIFVNGNLVPQFSSVRKSFVLPGGSKLLTRAKLNTLHQLMFECAKTAGRDAFDANLEFGDHGVVKVRVPVAEGGADAAWRVLEADLSKGVVTREVTERETDLLTPSTAIPGPPGTAPAGRGPLSGIDTTITWESTALAGRAATARPAKPWVGLESNFYGTAASTRKPTLTETMQHPRF